MSLNRVFECETNYICKQQLLRLNPKLVGIKLDVKQIRVFESKLMNIGVVTKLIIIWN